MSRKLTRYCQPEIINHLASNYVLGTLTARVKCRVDQLRNDIDYRELNAEILNWENRLSPLNNQIPALAPKEQSWEKIQAELNFVVPKQVASSKLKVKIAEWVTPKFYQWATLCSVFLVTLLSFTHFNESDETGALSYVAVLEDDNQQPQLVAATYGESKTLLLDIVTLPALQQGETFELWVKSKTDFQLRSLGEVPIDVASFSRDLSEAEWRLIKDSDSLLISIEEIGGSPIGEPMGAIISRGACVRLSAWQEQV